MYSKRAPRADRPVRTALELWSARTQPTGLPGRGLYGHHEVPVHHTLEGYLDVYLDVADIREQRKGPIFRTLRRSVGRPLSITRLSQPEAWQMIRRRARAAGILMPIGCHTFRGTGITAYLENGGTLEHAQQIAAHESPRTTKLYDRTTDQISLDEIERIVI